MFKTLSDKIPKDPDYPDRVHTLTVLKAVLDGTIYDSLEHPFANERSSSGEYIPLAERRPSVRYNLCRIVTEDSVGLLFSEGHFPTINSTDSNLVEFFAALVKETNLNWTMIDAGIKGSVGSVAILFKVMAGRPFYEVLETTYLTPKWKALAPDTLECVTEQYKVTKRALIDAGYAIPGSDNMNTQYWYRRDWTELEEIHYLPISVSKVRSGKETFSRDESKTVKHNLGFVPVVWIKNLPPGGSIDGWCTFKLGIDDQIEIEYQLSQGGRGLKYSSDPVTLIKAPLFGDGDSIRSASNALIVSGDGDAKLLEITGEATRAIIDYVKTLREFGIEAIHGNRSNAEKISVAQSGRAMEMMNQSLIGLADKLRITYAESGLVSLLKMAVLASNKMKISVDGKPYKDLDKSAKIVLEWPAWYAPTSQDLLTKAQALEVLVDGQMISRPTAVRNISPDYDIEDIEKELTDIETQHKADIAEEAAAAAAIKTPKLAVDPQTN